MVVLQSYRAYKWAIKRPQCASQILCTINEVNEQDSSQSPLQRGLLRVTSFPAAWAVSNKLGSSFWVLYGAIMEHDRCIVSETALQDASRFTLSGTNLPFDFQQKYPADCTEFHEEEIRVTTESTHSEL